MQAVYATLPLFGQARQIVTRAMASWMLFTATDLFCGAGGTTSGFEAARYQGQKVVSTTQVVNHDALAIASHKANHEAAKHFIEDITRLDANLLVRTALLWASLECTNFSNAKGGQSRDADSRTLAEHMERYIRAVQPLYFMVENVREFMAWGPLVQKRDKQGNPCTRRVKVMQDVLRPDGQPKLRKNGKPVQRQVVNEIGELCWEDSPVMIPESRTKGRDFLRWKQSIEDLGYVCHYRLLNAADYGERTSRIRLFMVFAKVGLPVRWPEATHSKGGKTLGTEPWLPVRPCLRLDLKGRSIFNRTRTNKKGEQVADPLVEKTLQRIYAGLCQYVAGRDMKQVTAFLQGLASGESGGVQLTPEARQAWLLKRSSNAPSGKPNPGVHLNGPGPTLACGFLPDVVQPEFLSKALPGEFLTNPGWYGGNKSVDDTGNTIIARQDKAPLSMVQPEYEQGFLTKYYSSGNNVSGFADPSGALTCNDRMGVVQTEAELVWLDKRYGSGAHNHQSVHGPAGSILTNDHHVVTEAERIAGAEPWVMNTNFDNVGTSLDAPAPPLLASRHHPYVVQPQDWLLDNKFNNVGRSLDNSGPTLLTGDNHYLASSVVGAEPQHWLEQPDDSDTMRLIRRFMRVYGLSDVLMRMLLVEELLKIQGFPEGYVLLGSATDQKKFIGNSVPPKMSQRIVEAIYEAFTEAGLQDLLTEYEGSYATAA
ncbi:DNA cytosine methyltransferase [Hymenobacter mucosus]|uniref:DNA (cytosine-5-)-methyltransferase n=1 Tax=Hymenobacter mucosus TaxID=1411120 RepID=A0A238ZY46_9BACT|nr:DNA cytosine methyltransferase [Hymenobacter mucosus]SNR87573.1 DNA (cytosine-5)-methyltransferase 1 [Hymenobacter mucosus]